MRLITDIQIRNNKLEEVYYLQTDRKRINVTPMLAFLAKFGNCADEMTDIMEMMVNATLLKDIDQLNFEDAVIDGNTRYCAFILRELKTALSQCYQHTNYEKAENISGK